MKEFFKKFVAKLKIAVREIGNFLTNIAVPMVALICAIMEAVNAPSKAIEVMKKVEYWLFYACATKEKIDGLLEDVDE